ncbi:SLBB domain-containing protein [Mucilaginibacter ginkgonis]|uniref:SLBB domain-containing protein n=1 Tax=Mucilaginibacter ginkgonis TaxID=2682091 RepID=A0A6I4I6T3_9SPHI|nr:SLBB domain-containing protein [Mucilaginibacter ginkgonis]QQL50868.1 SLBB domain-containing protein [Mucilaginibacter ginkgonis]
MRLRFLFCILVLLSFAVPVKVMAQDVSVGNLSSLKVSDLSDDKITAIWNKLEESGLSETEAYKLMIQKGVPPDEVQAFKDRVTLLGLNGKKNKTSISNKARKQSVDYSRDSLTVVKKPTGVINATPKARDTTQALQVYGLDFFNQFDITFEPNVNMATPKGYVLGPGDNVIVLVTGLNESSQTSKVTPEGNLVLSYAGVVYVNGFTIEQATALIRNKMTRIYPGLKTGQTQITVNLGNTRSIRVTLTGEVKTPGSYTLSSLTTLFNALYNSGGPSINGSLRNIEIIRANRVYKTVDFYDFLQKGILSGNVRLEDQDVIRIPVYKKRVSIKGEVKRPAIYELKDDEQLEDLINYAGGYTDIAYKGIAKVEQINALEREIKDVPANLFNNFTPRNGDVITIGAITNRYANRVVLEGAVYRPGPYELTAGLTLSSLLKSARGLKAEAYMVRGFIKRTLPDLQKQFISFKPQEVASGAGDIPLMREDTVVVLDESTFISRRMVTVNGNVRTPSSFVYRKGMKLSDVIAMAGGFTDVAAERHVEVSRIIRNEQDSVANQVVQSFNIDMSAGTNNDIPLEPMDYIFVQRLVNYRSLGNVSVKGEVLFPGDYAVQRRDESARDFIQRAGGITPYGSLENAQVFRKGVRVNLDLTNLSNDKLNRESQILLEGDSIYVPRVITFVDVTGAVNNPQLINYDNSSFKYYINAAGGTTSKAYLKGAYIKYPNGLNRPVRHFLFFRNYPSVKPGSKIIVPEKDPSLKFRLSVGDITGIASALTALISLIAILRTKN